MNPRFKFYEIVKVRESSFAVENKINGLKGIILGMVEDENGNWFYSVQIYSENEGWDLPEEHLESTGKFTTREEFYGDDSIIVKVNPETGEGEIIDKDD